MGNRAAYLPFQAPRQAAGLSRAQSQLDAEWDIGDAQSDTEEMGRYGLKRSQDSTGPERCRFPWEQQSLVIFFRCQVQFF